MPNIRVRAAIEKIDRELNRVGEHALQYSGIPRRDALDVKLALQDIIRTAQQLMELAEHPVD